MECVTIPKVIEEVSSPKPKSCVIGAGISGIRAALKLQEEGFEVTVLEASSTLGGRLKQVCLSSFDKKFALEMGASWIHNIENNPLTTLAEQYKLSHYPTDYQSYIFYHLDGKPLSAEEVMEFQKVRVELLNFIKEAQVTYPPFVTLQECVDAFCNLYPEKRYYALCGLHRDIISDSAGDPSLMSLLYDQDSYFMGGDHLVINYSDLATALAKDLSIHFDKKVTSIQDLGSSISILTSDGEAFNADYAICTVPLGVLKSLSILFQPPHSPRKQQAIDHLEMGNLQKTMLVFETPFWDPAPDFIGLMSPNGAWIEFLNLYKFTGQPILVGANTGAFATELEKLPQQDIIDSAITVLRKIYGPDVPEPSHAYVTYWSQNPYSYGAYSFFGRFGTIEDIKALGEMEGRIAFAGEATSLYMATVQGAYLSGERAAEDVLSHYAGTILKDSASETSEQGG